MEPAVANTAFSTGVAIALAAPITAVVLAALQRTRRSNTSEGGTPVLTTPTPFLLLGVGFVLVGAAIHVAVLLTLPARLQALQLFGAFFSLGGGYISWDSYRTRHVLADDALIYRGAFRAARVDWNTLATAEWKPNMGGLIVRTLDQKKLGFGAQLNGFSELARALEKHAPQLQYDDGTAEVLAAARRGEAPALHPIVRS